MLPWQGEEVGSREVYEAYRDRELDPAIITDELIGMIA
jgi:hypothetical protein